MAVNYDNLLMDRIRRTQTARQAAGTATASPVYSPTLGGPQPAESGGKGLGAMESGIQKAAGAANMVDAAGSALMAGQGAGAAAGAAGAAASQAGKSGLASILSMFSSARFKTSIEDLGDTVVPSLRPVRFQYLEDAAPRYGLIAEEVAAVAPELVFLDEDGKPLGVNYLDLIALLIKEVQSLRATVEGTR